MVVGQCQALPKKAFFPFYSFLVAITHIFIAYQYRDNVTVLIYFVNKIDTL